MPNLTHPIPLITTTVRTGHNPGDTFIGAGLQYLFEQAFGRQRWLLIDRFRSDGFRRHEALLRAAPFIVYGGMPQYNNYDDWMYWYDGKMWEQFIRPWGLKVYTMAGGAGLKHPKLTVEEYVSYCMKSAKTQRVIRARVPSSLCFTVRDPYAHALLNALEIPNRHLPCSATWATKMWGIQPEKDRPYLFLVPPTLRYRSPKWRAGKTLAAARPWAEIHATLKRAGHNAKVLCHTEDDYRSLSGLVSADDLWHHGDCYTLLRQYASAHTVVSARLHGSLPAFGIPGTKVLNLSVDVRGSAVEILPKIRNLMAATFDGEAILTALKDTEPSDISDLEAWEEAYREIIVRSLMDSQSVSVGITQHRSPSLSN